MVFIFDLDGTLIDSSERMYRVFCDTVPQSRLSKDEYWTMKRKGMNHAFILERMFPDTDPIEFERIWTDLIEQDQYLGLDVCYSDTVQTLQSLSESNDIILLTARQRPESLDRELSRLGIGEFFSSVLTSARVRSKKELLHGLVRSLPDSAGRRIYVSDSGSDILLGKEAGCETVAVTCGFSDRERLFITSPDHMIGHIGELVALAEIL